MDKLPLEIIFHITPRLGAFDLYHFLTAYHCLGLYHDLHPDVFNSPQDGSVALYHAIRMGRLDLMKGIPKIRQLITAIDTFTRYPGQSDVGYYFAGKEKEFAASNCDGYINPLTVAIIQHQKYPTDDLEIIRFLLENGADPNVGDLFHRQSPLFIAANSGDHGAVSLLLDFGADQNRCSREDSLLLQDGSLSESPFEQWKSLLPLDAAVRGCHIQTVKILAENGGMMLCCPFRLLNLKAHQPPIILMEIFQTLHRNGNYLASDSQIRRLLKLVHPTIILKTRQSPRIEKITKNRRANVNRQFSNQFAAFKATWF